MVALGLCVKRLSILATETRRAGIAAGPFLKQERELLRCLLDHATKREQQDCAGHTDAQSRRLWNDVDIID